MPVFLSVNLFRLSLNHLILTIKEKKLASNMPPEATDTDNKQDERSDLESKRTLSPEARKSLIFLLSSVFLWFTAYNAVTTAFSRYAVEVWGLSGGDFADCLMVATIRTP